MRKNRKNSKGPERTRKDSKAFQKPTRKKLRIELDRTEHVDRVICRAGSAYLFAAFCYQPIWCFCTGQNELVPLAQAYMQLCGSGAI